MRRHGAEAHGRRQRRLCLIVDVEKYSGRSNSAQMTVQGAVARTLDYACEQAGIRWEACERQDRGDGQLLLLPVGADESRVVPGLVRGLRDMVPALNARAPADGQIRLRAALAQGSVQRAPLGYVAWSVELASRLVDSAELRTALAEASGSDVALIVSSDLYADTFVTGAGGLPGSSFRKVRVEMPEKRFSSEAWISVLPRGRTVLLGVPTLSPDRTAPRRGGSARALGGAAAAAVGMYGVVRAAEADPQQVPSHSAHKDAERRPINDEHDVLGVHEQDDVHLHDGRHGFHGPDDPGHHHDHEGIPPMSHDSDQTWDDGQLTESDVIESADGTGYTSVSEFVAGENGYEPDPVSSWEDDSTHHDW